MLSGMALNESFVAMINRKDMTDEMLLDAMESFISLYDQGTFLQCYKNAYMSLTATHPDDSNSEFRASILFKMILEDKFLCLKKLIDVGVDVNDTVRHDENRLHGLNAVILAANKDRIEICRLLLSREANIFQKLGDDSNILHQVSSAEICDMIIAKAKETNDLDKLLNAYDSNHLNPILFACLARRPAVITSIIKATDITQYFNPLDLLETAINENWDEVVTLLKPIVAIMPKYSEHEENTAYNQLVTSFDTNLYSSSTRNEKEIRAYILKYGRRAFAIHASQPNIECGTNCSEDNEVEKIYCTPLFIAAYKGAIGFVKYLLYLNVDINSGTKCAHADANNISPLAIACDKGHESIVKLLLENGADIFKLTGNNKSCLVNAFTKKTYDLILTKADETGTLDKFLYLRCTINTAFPNSDIFTICAIKKRFDILNYLLDNSTWAQFADLIMLRSACMDSALESSFYSHNAMQIVTKLQKQIPSFELLVPIHFKRNEHQADKENNLDTLKDGFKRLFGTEMTSTPVLSKESALRIANAHIITLLYNPHRCLPFLRFLNDEFVRYIEENHKDLKLPEVVRSEFASVYIDRTEYLVPMPDSRYLNSVNTKHDKQYSILKEFLISIFKKHDLAETVVKWIGFVNQAEADKMVKAGHFIIESSSAGVSLLHGGLSHVIQTMIIIYAIERGDIRLDYIEDGQTKTLTIKELLASHVELKNANGESIWSDMRDVRMKGSVRFCDPYRLFAHIMREGHQWGIDKLSDYLTHGFAKSLIKYQKTMAKLVPIFSSYTTFLNAIANTPSHIIFNRQHIIQLTVDKYENATFQRDDIIGISRYKVTRNRIYGYAIAHHYQPKLSFSPRIFTPEISKTYEVTAKVTVNEDDWVYVSGADRLLGNNFFAAAMYYDAVRKCWAYNLPPGIKQREHHFLTGSKRAHFTLFTRQQDGEPMIEASYLEKVKL